MGVLHSSQVWWVDCMSFQRYENQTAPLCYGNYLALPAHQAVKSFWHIDGSDLRIKTHRTGSFWGMVRPPPLCALDIPGFWPYPAKARPSISWFNEEPAMSTTHVKKSKTLIQFLDHLHSLNKQPHCSHLRTPCSVKVEQGSQKRLGRGARTGAPPSTIRFLRCWTVRVAQETLSARKCSCKKWFRRSKPTQASLYKWIFISLK